MQITKSTLTAITAITLLTFTLSGCFAVSDSDETPVDNSNINNQTMTNNPNQELIIETITPGTGEAAKSGDTIEVHYVGTLTDGTKFDSSRDRGNTFSFTIGAGNVIQGWEEGTVGMQVGEIRKLTIPSELGYGSNSIGSIPANSTLIFEIELIGIN